MLFQPQFRKCGIDLRLRNQWFTETIETIHIRINLIISTIRFFKTFTAEFGFNRCKESLLNNVESRKRFGSF